MGVERMNVSANCDGTHGEKKCLGKIYDPLSPFQCEVSNCRLADDVEFCLLFHEAVYRVQAETCKFDKLFANADNFASQRPAETISPLGKKKKALLTLEVRRAIRKLTRR